MKETLNRLLEKYSHVRRDSLIPILQDIQDEIGYLSEEAVVMVGQHLNLPTSKIYGLATFYNQFRFEPRGKYHILLCHGTACHLNGGQPLIDSVEKLLKIKAGQTTRNGQFSIEVVPCLGACAQAPVMVINGEYHSNLTPDKAKEILENLAGS
jgi:NADH-quinone oxidoreductase E subunit